MLPANNQPITPGAELTSDPQIAFETIGTEAKQSDKSRNHVDHGLTEETKAGKKGAKIFLGKTARYFRTELHRMDLLQKLTLLLAAIGVVAAIHAGTALAFIGIAGVIAVFCTLRAISNQTIEIAKSVGAMTRQAESIERQSEILLDGAQRELRAYVNVESALLRFYGPNRYEAHVHFRNFGQTPALDMETWLQVTEPQTYPLKKAETRPIHQAKAASILPPGGKITLVESPPNSTPNLPTNFAPGYDIGTPRKTVFVYGELTYKDVFNQRRCTKYRLMFGGPYASGPGFQSHARKVKKIQDGIEIETGILQWDTEGNETH